MEALTMDASINYDAGELRLEPVATTDGSICFIPTFRASQYPIRLTPLPPEKMKERTLGRVVHANAIWQLTAALQHVTVQAREQGVFRRAIHYGGKLQ